MVSRVGPRRVATGPSMHESDVAVNGGSGEVGEPSSPTRAGTPAVPVRHDLERAVSDAGRLSAM
jgi:hypothetical protein